MSRSVALVLAITGLVLTSACGGGGGSGESFHVSSNILDELQPGTTLHMVQVPYSRHGPAEETLRLHESYQPETLRGETWMAFAENGAVASVRTETRSENGDLFATSHLDGEDVVYEEQGEEVRRTHIGAFTLDSYRTAIADATHKLQAEVGSHPNAPIATIGGLTAVVLERNRHPYTAPQQDVGPTSYVSVYVYDLQPVEKFSREYALPGGTFTVRDEDVVVGLDGTETVIESWDYTTLEVLND